MVAPGRADREQSPGVAPLRQSEQPLQLANLVATIGQCALTIVLDPEVAAGRPRDLDFSERRGIAPEPERVAILRAVEKQISHLTKTRLYPHEFSGSTFLPETSGVVSCSPLGLSRPGPPTSRQPYEE